MTTELLSFLQYSTLLVSLALLCVLALRGVWLRFFGARNVMLLWLSVPITMLALFMPAPVELVDTGMPLSFASTTVSPAPVISGPVSEPGFTIDMSILSFGLWLAGAVAMTALLAVRQWRYRRSLGRLEKKPDGSFRSQFNDKGPALVGALNPRIVVPADFDRRYSPQQQSLIMAHERCHLRRGDAQLTLLGCLFRCFFWFNPLVHMAWSRFRIDQELACDASVLRANPESRREYAEAMLATQFTASQLPVGCTWLTGDPLRRRITMLYTRPPGKIQLLAGTILALTASTAAAVGAWSSQEPQLRYSSTATPQLELAAVTTPAAAPEPALPRFAARVTAPSLASVADRHGRGTRAALAPPAPAADSASPARSAPASPAPAAAPAPAPAPAPAADQQSSSESGATVDTEPARLVEVSRPSFPRTFNKPELVSYPGMPEAEQPGPDWQPEGWIWEMKVRVELDEEGRPVEANIANNDFSSGGMVRRYERLALRAVKNWRYEPARIDGKPVRSELMMAFHFDTSMARPNYGRIQHPYNDRVPIMPNSVRGIALKVPKVYK